MQSFSCRLWRRWSKCTDEQADSSSLVAGQKGPLLRLLLIYIKFVELGISLQFRFLYIKHYYHYNNIIILLLFLIIIRSPSRGHDTCDRFSVILCKGVNFCDFLYAFLYTKPLLKGAFSKRKEFAPIKGKNLLPWGANSFLIE